jgi:NAD-dependent dihydropyrimidine dehydrogenase PreA subunit
VDKGVASYDDVRKIFNNDEITGGDIAIMDCVCRKSKDIVGDPCKQSELRETCFTLNRGARMSLEKGWSRRVNKEEALSLLEIFEKEGFIIQVDNSQHPFFICNCCGCCCELTTNLRKFDKPIEYIDSNNYAEIDHELCSGCGVCVERCLMAAAKINEDKSYINLDRCIGCGLCIPTCPENAISLKRKDIITEPPVNRVDLYTKIIDKKAELARQKKS